MALITQTYSIDLVPNGAPLVVNVSQYDTASRTLVFNLFNGGVAYAPETGTAAYLMGTKPDKTGFSYGMTVNGTQASLDIEQQMTAVAGTVPCEIRLVDPSGAVIGTANFTLNVEKAALDEDTVISESDIPVFENLAAQAAASAADAATSAQNAAAVAVNYFPSTGTVGQFLQKTATGNQYADINALPSGGTTGQVLTKQSGNDGDANWESISIPPSNLEIILTQSQGTYAANHTYAEILANIEAGGLPYVFINDQVYNLAMIGPNFIQFKNPGQYVQGYSAFAAGGWASFQVKPTAANSTYSNTASGLTATTVQAAIDELKALIDAK